MTIGTPPSLESTQLVGAVLMHQFARDRFIEAGINEKLIPSTIDMEEGGDPANSSVNINDTSTNSCDPSSAQYDISVRSEQYHSIAESTSSPPTKPVINLDKLQSSPAMTYYGRQLRLLAEEFEKDRKRLEVKDNANKVKLEDITRENFVKLLEELFQDRITREKIVVLFFFCTDVALRAASFAQELVVKLMGWSFSYIINTVCRIVHELGGWDNLLFRQLPSLLVTCCAALGICALTIYLRKSLRA